MILLWYSALFCYMINTTMGNPFVLIGDLQATSHTAQPASRHEPRGDAMVYASSSGCFWYLFLLEKPHRTR
jgi:hypothetical protein